MRVVMSPPDPLSLVMVTGPILLLAGGTRPESMDFKLTGSSSAVGACLDIHELEEDESHHHEERIEKMAVRGH